MLGLNNSGQRDFDYCAVAAYRRNDERARQLEHVALRFSGKVPRQNRRFETVPPHARPDNIRHAAPFHVEGFKDDTGVVAEPPDDGNIKLDDVGNSVLVHLGVMEDPSTGKKVKNLPLAKQTIDILGMLEEKTKGNLEDDEEKMLKNILYDLRMIYIKEKE